MMRIFSFRFTLRWNQKTFLPKFKASKFRGSLGHILKSLSGSNPNSPYFLLFETPNSSNGNYPHPFWLEFPDSEKMVYQEGEKFEFNLLLLGKFKEYLPYFVYTFIEIGKRGMIDNFFYELKEVWQEGLEENAKIYSESKELTPRNICISLGETTKKITNKMKINFVSPTCIRQNGKVLSEIDFEIFYKTLARRILLLRKANEIEEILFDHKKLTELSKEIKTCKKNFEKFRVNRWSNRQMKKIALEGFIGSAIFEGDFEPFQEILEFGQFVHVGKNTVFGFGKFELEFL